jgi:hypothetical protein
VSKKQEGRRTHGAHSPEHRPHDDASSIPDRGGVAGPFKAAVWAWRLCVPHGCAGRRYMAALERQLAAHVARNLEAMLHHGWPPDQAQAAAHQWLCDLADTTAHIAFDQAEVGR